MLESLEGLGGDLKYEFSIIIKHPILGRAKPEPGNPEFFCKIGDYLVS